MDVANRNVISSSMRKTLKDKLDFHYNALEFAIVKLFISYQSSRIWESTQLEGFLVLVNDSFSNCLRISIFDFINFNKEFEIEIYTNIEEGYEIITDCFHCIEYPGFFIGLNFSEKYYAEKIRKNIFIYNKIKNQDNFFTFFSEEKEPISDQNSGKNMITSNTVSMFSQTNNQKNILNTEEFNKKYVQVFKEISEGNIHFMKVERLLDLQIEKNLITNIKTPIVSPDLELPETKLIFEKNITSKQIYFQNIQGYFGELKEKYDKISMNQNYEDSGSIYNVEDENNENENSEHNNENEEFITYNYDKRKTIRIRSDSYMQKFKEIKDEGEKMLQNSNQIVNSINSNDKNNFNGNSVNNNNSNSNSKLGLNRNEENKINLIEPTDKSNKGIPMKQNNELINRYSNNMMLNHAINQKKNTMKDIEESSEQSRQSDF